MNRILKISAFLAGVFLTSLASIAQDVHLSQFYASPQLLNPANAGFIDGKYRLGASYRTQWWTVDKPYNTVTISGDSKLYFIGQEFGWGGVYIYDYAAGIENHKLIVSGAYQFDVLGHNVGVGLQTGVNFSHVATEDYVFEDQLAGKLPSSADYEVVPSIIYPALNVGVKWEKKFKKWKPFAGIQILNLNNPTDDFSGYVSTDNRKKLRQMYSVGADVYLSKKITAEPRVLYMREMKVVNQVMGSNFAFISKENIYGFESWYLGAFTRANFVDEVDAVIGVVGVRIKDFDVGFSYDVNISDLSKATNYHGAFEVTLTYTKPGNLLDVFTVPLERF